MIRNRLFAFALLAAVGACATELENTAPQEDTAVGGGKEDSAFARSAGFQRYAGAFCYAIDEAQPVDYTGGRVTPAAADGTAVMCPVFDDSGRDKATTNRLNVHVYDGNAGASPTATACVKYYGWPGATCGANAVSNRTTGDATLQPSVSVWRSAANAGHFAYVFVRLPAQQAGQSFKSQLNGYFVN